MFNIKTSIAAALFAIGAASAGTAQAGNVQWSIGINLPAVGTVISSQPVYQAPVPVHYYPPAPVYVRPAPVVVYKPAPVVVYSPPPVYYPSPVVRSGWAVPVYEKNRGHGHHRHGGRHDRDDRDGRDNHRDEYGDRYQEGRWSAGPRSQHH